MISAEAFFDEERSALLSFEKKTIYCFVPQDTKNKAERWLREHGYLQTFGSRRR